MRSAVLLTGLLLDLLFLVPAKIGTAVLEGIRDAADKERLVTEESIKDKLKELQVSLEQGEISEEEYEEVEEMLINRLKLLRQGGEG